MPIGRGRIERDLRVWRRGALALGRFPEGVRVHAGAPVNVEQGKTYDFDVVDLPAVEQVATVVHHGPMDDVDAAFQQLGWWIAENGYRSTGFAREVYLKYGDGDPETWVTELQETVTRSA
jgi:effector-binding domain-containing protein